MVSIDGHLALLEPEQTGGCGGCASAAMCDSKGIGTLASRLEMRRFALPNELSLRVGDRVVLGITPFSLLGASAITYLIPLLLSLLAAGLAQWRWGSDLVTMGAAFGGLLPGFLVTRQAERYLAPRKRDDIQILRLAGTNDHSC
ncbi:MAG: Fis family transcriptional regulator [Candidatus Dactylopiibacterium carminicum]|uniref:Fis family transcriptional regulator n=1 Tax=Candidatus Dactylopiibacterium carminicum TaxID=857335 RepID=A0A272ER05_9RHOO|nr:SoxR reducing system RseC family protein [Candidatus Dactylopiibacterium carminicum]KAF7598685.1 Fis family transcriptional regulator [Candidatus Dactylopiibacterium carminicum]PAS92502.1 MAG: Fis family transcriptional regulator [Candidatus Dactylopiibacterium carminicum]PAS96298.1 MAG: Fis family transcriptional regulator [Candidatus Dactylopiibacterium carminicum]